VPTPEKPSRSSEPDRSRGAGKLEGRGSYAKVARASVIWGYLRVGLQAVITIPSTIALARMLTPEEFGIAAAASFFGQLSARLASGGLGQVIVRQKDLRSDHISTVFTINAAITAILVILLLAGAPAIGRFYGRQEVAWLIPAVGVTFALGALSTVQQALLNRDLRYKESATIATLDTTVTAVTAVVFAALGFRYWSLVLGDLCGAFVKFVYGVRVVGWHARLQFVPSTAREIRSFAAGSYAKRLLEHLTRNVDNLIIGRVLGMSALGFYDKAFSVVNKLFSKMTVVGPSVSFRIFSALQDEQERLRLAYQKVLMTTTLMTYGVFAAVGVMAPHLIVVAFGEKWRPAILPCQVLCFSFALKVMDQYAMTASNARGWVWPHVWRQVISVACIVCGVYYAAPRWGIDGAALAVLGSAVISSILTQGILQKATGMGWRDTLKPQVPGVTVATLVILTLWTIDTILAARVGSPTVMVVQAATAFVIVLSFAVWCPFPQVRVLLFDAVSDYSPTLAGRLWQDVGVRQRAAKKERRAGRGRNGQTEPKAEATSPS
jgi:O-antigen/teichoic acid export membrane protein